MLLISFLSGCANSQPGHQVLFISNGGTVVESIEVRNNSTFKAPAISKEGNTLLGWYLSEDSGLTLSREWNFSNDIVTEALVLYASWDVNSYTISFNSNGGSYVAPLTRLYGLSINKPTNPVLINYQFENWYEDSALSNLFIFQTMPSRDLTLYANWTYNPVVTSINFTYDKIGLSPNETYQMTYDILPINASNKTLTWSSSNNLVATVSSSGLILAKTTGSVTILATSSNGINQSAKLTVYFGVGDRVVNESEPNSFKSSADTISSNGTTVRGTNSNSDIDYYSVYLTSGSYFNLLFVSQYTIDASWYLIGIENSSTLLEAIYGSDQILEYSITNSGTYYLVVLYSTDSPYSNGDGYSFYVYWF